MKPGALPTQLASTISLWRRRSVLAAAIGIAELVVPDTGSSAADLGAAQSQRGFAARTGSLFTTVPSDPYAAPRITEIGIPPFPGAHAIWGATGRDDRGHVWFGVSADGGERSAHLFEYDPGEHRMRDRGDVLSNLRRIDRARPGESQVKIHSRIIPADDGYLYFTSTDEEGEQKDGSAPPRWGSHLWRLQPDGNSDHWEHLLAVPEGLTCAAGIGRWIYALGLWNHVLYRFDTAGGPVRRVVVGSVGGHMSRNLVVDTNGHVYVPRVHRELGTGALRADLVQFDPGLTEISSAPLANYARGPNPTPAHGIIGLVYLADGAIVIATGIGFLHRITPRSTGPAQVDPLGWLHPRAAAYTPGLFTWDGARYLVGLAAPAAEPWHWQWVVFDLVRGSSAAIDFRHGLHERTLLYGSLTRDNVGSFYIAGRTTIGSGAKRPLLLQVATGP